MLALQKKSPTLLGGIKIIIRKAPSFINLCDSLIKWRPTFYVLNLFNRVFCNNKNVSLQSMSSKLLAL